MGGTIFLKGSGARLIAGATVDPGHGTWPDRTLDLARARAALLELETRIAVLGRTGQSAAAELARRIALQTEITAIETHITQMRALYGTTELARLESAQREALTELARLEMRAGAPGMSPSQRASFRSSAEFRRARTMADTATDRLRVAYETADAGFAQEIISTQRTPEGVFRIRLRNATDQVEAFTAHDFANRIANDPIASRSYRQLQLAGVEVILDFGIPPTPNALGDAGFIGEVRIYMRNITNAREAVAVMVHESSHVRQFETGLASFARGNTQYNEYVAFRREYLFRLGRKPTLAERDEIAAIVRELYDNLPVGRPFP